MSAARSWFNHVLEAPLLPAARQAVAGLAEEMGCGPLPPERRDGIVESARKAVADLLRVAPEQIILTSGGTEAANLAIKGVARAARSRRLVTSAVEHLSILHPVRSLGREGFEVRLLAVDRSGRVDPDELEQLLRASAGLVSVQHGNHEVGTVQPIADLAEVARRHGAPFHTDAVATAGLLGAPTGPGGADLVSLSGSRLGAVPGTGALWVREGIRLLPQIEGGTQEGGRRAGTANLLGLASLAAAAGSAAGAERERAEHVRRLRDRLETGLQNALPDLEVNGPPADERLPGHLNASFPGVEGESLLFRLRRAGVEASTGSACAGEIGKPSHVLEAMGLGGERAQRSVLFSLGPASRDHEVDHALDAVPAAAGLLREISGGPGS